MHLQASKIEVPQCYRQRPRNPRETLINSMNVMKREARGTQRPRHIDQIDEEASTAQRSDSLVQSINQRFPSGSE
jgi:hypothetical protein